jgi:hypothetical protein
MTAMPVHEATTPGRDAIIFLPALGVDWTDQSVETMARRLATAFDRAAVREASFVAKLGPAEAYGSTSTNKVGVATISRVDGSHEVAVADLYGFDYHQTLTAGIAERNLLLQAVSLLVMIGYSTGRLVGVVHRRPREDDGTRAHSKRATEVLQVVFGALILLLFCVYAGIVVAALIKSGSQLPAFLHRRPAEGSLLQAAVVAITALGLSRPKVRATVSRAAVNYLGATTYLGFGARRADIAGKLEALLEHVAERRAPIYERIHVIAYSFGSIVALDTLFPRSRQPPRRAEDVRALVTIGCPFDMVRTYWRDYFDDRERPIGERTWWNVYSPEDVLSSNFRNDADDDVPTVGITTTGHPGNPIKPIRNIQYNPSGADHLSISGLFVMAGLRAHATYWDEDPDADTCLTAVVTELYAGAPALQ